MAEGTSKLRIRALVGSWFALLAALLLAFALVGGAAAYTASVDPGTTTEQVDQTHWEADGGFHHSADVTRENPVFAEGSTLSNRSTYYTGASPELDGQYALAYAGADAEPATVDLEAALVMESSSDETVFWTDRQALESTSDDSVAPGESVELGFTLNATEVADRRSEIVDELGDAEGEVSTYVAVNVSVDGTVNGESADLSFTHRLPVEVSDGTYTVGPEETGSEPMTTTQSVSTTRSYGPVWSLGGPLLLLVGVSGLAGLAVGRRRDAFDLSAAERDLLAFRDERAEFDEWVVRATLSTAFEDRPRAEAASLEDVVDFAIDAGTGVVEDPVSGLFYAVAEELVVVYEPPALARETLRDGPASTPRDGTDETGDSDGMRTGIGGGSVMGGSGAESAADTERSSAADGDATGTMSDGVERENGSVDEESIDGASTGADSADETADVSQEE
ncbi:MAG: DUF5305 domain-containing protein [archaeon]